MSARSCAILNSGSGSWAFEEHAERLSRAIGVEVRSTPAQFNYLLGWDGPEPPASCELFIPYDALLLAADKHRLAEVFEAHGIAVPRTHLLETPADVLQLIRRESWTEWVLKFPTGCGGSGHRLLGPDDAVPERWPRPYVVQEFVRMEAPEVYRLYGVAGELFGWNARRFPSGVAASPWVAHARGARYEDAGDAPEEAEHQAREALRATGLLDSFGCADLLRHPDGRWLVLEVGTDGLFNHVDREVDLPCLAEELDRRIGDAFRSSAAARAL